MLTPAEALRRLVGALQALALDAQIQISLFPSFVCVADELALNLDDQWLHRRLMLDANLLTEEQARRIATLNDLLAEMSVANQPTSLWTADALEHAPEWERVRVLSRECLHSLGKAAEVPSLDWLEFIPTKTTRKR